MNNNTITRSNGTGNLDPAIARALFLSELDTLEMTSRIPQAEPGDAESIY
jgi:hypothetical protein